MKGVISNLYTVLKSGGMLIFRDYGVHDSAQLRFKSQSELGKNYFMRQNGTFSYFFELEYLRGLFVEVGFDVVELLFVYKKVAIRKLEVEFDRVFVQAKFVKR